MSKDKLKPFLLFTLVTQYFVIAGTLNEFLNIGLVITISGVLIFTFLINATTDIMDYLKTRSVETLILINTTLFMFCFAIKDNIYTKLIKGGIKDLDDQINPK